MNLKRVLTSALAGAIVCGFAWLIGYDFNERGFAAAMTAWLALGVAVLTYLAQARSES